MIYKIFGQTDDKQLVVFTLTHLQMLFLKLMRQQMNMTSEYDTSRLLLALAKEGMIKNVMITTKTREEIIEEYMRNNPDVEEYKEINMSDELDRPDNNEEPNEDDFGKYV